MLATALAADTRAGFRTGLLLRRVFLKATTQDGCPVSRASCSAVWPVLASLRTAAVFGVEACPVHVEVDVSFGFPSFTMVGLPDASVRESRDRVRSAIRNSGFEFPPHRITVNLAPADVRKAGASFDLPIALGHPRGSGDRRAARDCRLRAARRAVARRLDPPDARRAADCRGRQARRRRRHPSAGGERQRSRHRRGTRRCSPSRRWSMPCERSTIRLRRRRVRLIRRPPPYRSTRSPTLRTCADSCWRGARSRLPSAGGHNLLLVGPPGAGKTMMARRLPGILPPLTFDEALEVTAVHSVAGLLPRGAGLRHARPFRAPHHTISDVALVGGGAQPRPGEVSLAHHGVLFLDEMLEFSRHVLEVLRQPLEEGSVTVARAARVASFPARFVLVGAMNPCPCGFAADPTRECRCTPQQFARYRSRLSGPLRDRLDLTVDVPALPPDVLDCAGHGRTLRGCARARRGGARRQRGRYGAGGVRTNAELTPSLMAQYCGTDAAGRRLLGLGCRAPGAQRPRVRPRPESGANDRRPGGSRCDRGRSYRRGAAVSHGMTRGLSPDPVFRLMFAYHFTLGRSDTPVIQFRHF